MCPTKCSKTLLKTSAKVEKTLLFFNNVGAQNISFILKKIGVKIQMPGLDGLDLNFDINN